MRISHDRESPQKGSRGRKHVECGRHPGGYSTSGRLTREAEETEYKKGHAKSGGGGIEGRAPTEKKGGKSAEKKNKGMDPNSKPILREGAEEAKATGKIEKSK